MATTLEEAHATVIEGAMHLHRNDREADTDDPYGRKGVHRAIRWAGQNWCDHTHCVQGATSVSLSAGSHIVDITGTLTGFQPHMLMWANISGFPVKRVAPHRLIQRYRKGATPVGRPTMIAFEGATRMWLHPEPEQAYTLSIYWWQPFTSFTIGEPDEASVTLNIPDIYIDTVLRLGAASALAYGDSDPAAGMVGSKGYEMYVAERTRVSAEINYSSSVESASDSGQYRHDR